MPSILLLPEPLLASTQAFLAEQGIPLVVASERPPDGTSVVEVVQGDRAQQSEAARLVAGGRIPCAVALGLAKRLGVAPGQLGALLDHLEVKVHACSLGCF